MPTAVTDHLQLLLSELETNQALRADFVTNPANAIAPFNITVHERHAVLKRDCNDFVALGVVASTGQLPDLFGCPGGGGGIDISDLLDALRERLKDLLKEVRPRFPDPPFPPDPPPGPGPVGPPGPGPLPGPRPGSGPRPRPTPGPDPPNPNRPRPGRGGPAGGGPAG